MHFASATWLLGLPLLGVIWLLVKASDRRVERRSSTLLGTVHARHREGWHPQLRGWRRFSFLMAAAWLLLALARPQWGASEVTVTQRGRDVLVALDISNSMLAEDVAPNRLERAKAELTSFLRSQQEGRVGLVLFAGAAFVQCPLTADFGTLEIFLQMAAPDMISAQGTALASALAVSRDLLIGGRQPGSASDFQAILLVTDGEDLEGDWEAEARACVDAGITIIPVGIGEETGGLIPLPDDQGGFLKDDDGQLVLSRIDLASLERLAGMAGGSTFRVGLDGLAGERLRTVLDRLGARDFEQRRITAWQERYRWPLALALLSLLVAVSLRPGRGPGAAAVLLAGGLALSLPSAAAAQLVRPPGADAAARGREAYAAGQYEVALQEFESARALAPEDPRLALAVGEALVRLERWEEAEREFARARALTREDELRAESLYNSGTALLQQQQAEQAVDRLRESLSIEPGREDALRNLEAAMTLLEMQQQQQQQQQQQDQQQDQDQEQEQEQEKGQGENQGEDQQDQQGEQQQEQDQDQQDDPQDQHEQQEQQEQQEDPGQDQQQQQQPDADPTAEDLDLERALQMLRALDRDEQELKRSVEKRLQGGQNRSGKRW